MYADVFLEVVFELEGFGAVLAFELSQFFSVLVTQHVSLQSVDIREPLLTNSTHLQTGQTCARKDRI